MDNTGYAFAGDYSPISFDGDVTFLFAGDPSLDRPIDCDPFATGGAVLGSGSDLASVQFFAGIGIGATTSVSHSPATTGQTRAGLGTELVLKFRVVPDDPQATGPIQVDIITRFEIVDLQQESTGSGFGSSVLTGYILVRSLHSQGPSLGAAWYPESYGVPEGSSADFHELRDAPVNTDLFLRARLTQESAARGVRPPVQGSGAAALASEVSFEVVAVNDDATIIWGIEEELGLEAPMLGEVPEPSFAGSLLMAAGLLASFFRRPRQRVTLADS